MLLLFWLLTAYGMSTILVYGSIFDKQRDWIKKHSKFFGDLISCMLCTPTWVGFFMSLVFGGLTKHYLPCPWFVCLFFDGMVTAGGVWFINAITEFFEENRIK